jgi:hypothetical protein
MTRVAWLLAAVTFAGSPGFGWSGNSTTEPREAHTLVAASADDSEDCTLLRATLSTAGSASVAETQDGSSVGTAPDLGCQVFDGTGVWLAPDGTECGGAATGVCSAGVCVGEMQLASTLTFAATSEPTNMLLAPAVPPEGSSERQLLESEIEEALSGLLTRAVSGLQVNCSSEQLPPIGVSSVEITSIDGSSMEGSYPPVFYVSADYSVSTGALMAVANHESERNAEILASVGAALGAPRQQAGGSDALRVTLDGDSPFSAEFDSFEFELVRGSAWVDLGDTEGGMAEE